MPDQIISRGDVSTLIPEEYATEIAKAAVHESTVLQFGRRLRDMSRYQQNMPVLDALPYAYFVEGETGDGTGGGLKRTSSMQWKNKRIQAEEIAVLVPIPENILDDSAYPIWDEVMPHVRQAAGQVIDAAILLGTNAPTSWPGGIVPSAKAAGNSVILGTGTDVYDDILGTDGVFAAVETDGYMVTAAIAAPSFMGRLRSLRTESGAGFPIFQRAQPAGQDVQATPRWDLSGTPITFQRNGAFDETAVTLIAGDWSQLVYSFRKDFTFKILTEAVISDSDGKVILNLAR
jgi:HK97 family phage major capsid protein